MDWLQTVAVYTAVAGVVLLLHECTHLAVARLGGPYSVYVHSWIPFKLQLDFESLPSTGLLRVIALAPLLVGIAVAVLAAQAGIWREISAVDPYYAHVLVAAYWLLYVVPSPADLRLALWPPTDPSGVSHNPQ